MIQTVTITRRADRHEGPERTYADSQSYDVTAGPLPSVLSAAMQGALNAGYSLPTGAYSVSVSEPFEL